MEVHLKHILTRYINSRWLPAMISIAAQLAFAIVGCVSLRPLAFPAMTLMVLVGLSLTGILLAAVWNLFKRHWVTGIINLILLPVCGIAVFLTTISILVVTSMLGPSEDHFADNLAVPANNTTIAEPKKELQSAPGGPEDAFQSKLMGALKNTGSDDPSVTADVTTLLSLQQDHPDILRRWLATNPAWRVFKEDEAIFATRRWMIGSTWRYTLHGYYTLRDIHGWSETAIPDFQSRTTIGLSGTPWARSNSDATRMKAGETRRVALSLGNQMQESRCVITAGTLCLEVFEQTEAKERRLTKSALSYLNEELHPLVATPSWADIKASLPLGSIRRGEPSLDLRNSSQPGLYDSEIWVNPGELGMIYLKAFEVTKGTALSEAPLKTASNEWVGWSNDPSETFFSNTTFTIYEGDWGKPYAARFEVWFVPDSGAPERILMERAFKIAGWQR